MASLKEIKGRINSINGTLKITSAMKMVASAKLHKAQTAIANLLPYRQRMYDILYRLISDDPLSLSGRYTAERQARKVAIVAVASNSSLCGAFNFEGGHSGFPCRKEDVRCRLESRIPAAGTV